MLASTLGLDFDPEAAWNERKQIYEHSSLIIDSTRSRPQPYAALTIVGLVRSPAAVFLFS